MVGGGSPKPPTLHAEIKTEVGGIGVASGYGLTECPSLALGSVRDPDPKLAVTDGRAAPGVEIRIVADDGRVLGPGHVGEVRVRGPQLFHGYVDAALDADAFDADGFLRTGDLGRLDADGLPDRSPGGSRTSSSARARTSPPRRSRTSSTRTPRSPT